MNTAELLQYAHRILTEAVADLSAADWERRDNVIDWSAKDMIAHLIPLEQLAEGALLVLLDQDAPHLHTRLGQMAEWGEQFNAQMIAAYQHERGPALLTELTVIHQRLLVALAAVSTAQLHAVGTIPWYGSHYCVADLLMYSTFGHKLEHAAELKLVRSYHRRAARPSRTDQE